MSWLGPLAEEVAWTVTDEPIPDSDMAALFAEAENITKWTHHVPVYQAMFGPYRDKPITMLEIGVACGGSLEIWRNYFCSEATIVGVDGDRQCAQFDDPARNVYVRIGQQQDTAFLQNLVNEFGPFDVILDDGSHLPSYTLRTFQFLFLNGLNDGGVYLVEDIGHCYFGQRDPANDGSPTFVEVVKTLIDVTHAHYAATKTTDAFVASTTTVPPPPIPLPEMRVPLATTLISGIDIRDGIVAIHRQPRARGLPRLIHRYNSEYLNAWLRLPR